MYQRFSQSSFTLFWPGGSGYGWAHKFKFCVYTLSTASPTFSPKSQPDGSLYWGASWDAYRLHWSRDEPVRRPRRRVAEDNIDIKRIPINWKEEGSYEGAVSTAVDGGVKLRETTSNKSRHNEPRSDNCSKCISILRGLVNVSWRLLNNQNHWMIFERIS